MKKTVIIIVAAILFLLVMSGCKPYEKLCFNGKTYVKTDADFRKKDTFGKPTVEDFTVDKVWLEQPDKVSEYVNVYRLKDDSEGRMLFLLKDDSFVAYVQQGTKMTQENICGLYVNVNSLTVREDENTAAVYRDRTVALHGGDAELMLKYLNSFSLSETHDEAYSMSFQVAAEYENIPLCAVIRNFETGVARIDENICRMLADNIKSQYGGAEQ